MWTNDCVKLIDHWCSQSSLAMGGFSYVIAIPAKDEQETVEACLQACWQSMQRSLANGKILLVINNTRDDSQLKATTWARKTNCPLEIINIIVANEYAQAGLIRKMAMEQAALSLRSGGVIMSTDADSRPEPDWVAANLARIAEGYHLVCGDILLDSTDPQYEAICAIHSKNALEGQYRQACMELIHKVDPDPDNQWPHHNQVSGASLAITRQVHDAIGGVPAVPLAEDRALAKCIALHNYRICYCAEARVVTSCRMIGRAGGGMAEALRIRAGNGDYLIDESLEPAHLVLLRAKTRAWARRICRSSTSRHDLYEFLAIAPVHYGALDGAHQLGRFLHLLEQLAPGLQAERLLYSQLPTQLQTIQTMLEQVDMT